MIRAALYFIGFVAVTAALIFLQPAAKTFDDAPVQAVTRNEPDLTAITPAFDASGERRIVAEMVDATDTAPIAIDLPDVEPVLTTRQPMPPTADPSDMRALTWDTVARLNAATGRDAPAGRPGSLLHTIIKRSVADAGQGGTVQRYVVKPGDSLISIAQEVYGDANMTGPLYAANQSLLSGPNDLKAGQTLILPNR